MFACRRTPLRRRIACHPKPLLHLFRFRSCLAMGILACNAGKRYRARIPSFTVNPRSRMQSASSPRLASKTKKRTFMPVRLPFLGLLTGDKLARNIHKTNNRNSKWKLDEYMIVLHTSPVFYIFSKKIDFKPALISGLFFRPIRY